MATSKRIDAMNGLKTWTVRRKDFAIVVTADTVELAVRNISYELGLIVAVSELVPLPTHHRHVRLINCREGAE